MLVFPMTLSTGRFKAIFSSIKGLLRPAANDKARAPENRGLISLKKISLPVRNA